MPTLRSAGEQLPRAAEAAVGMERGTPAPTAGKEQSHTTAGRSQDANAFKMLQAPPEGPPAPEVSQGENMPHIAMSPGPQQGGHVLCMECERGVWQGQTAPAAD